MELCGKPVERVQEPRDQGFCCGIMCLSSSYIQNCYQYDHLNMSGAAHIYTGASTEMCDYEEAPA